ncbi:MAG: type IV secretion system DNA-binding domain-containing protein [Candidatus Pacebacteria bacterium]|nr:type IV secretion system DNA-binding domain-containing protein [Candidatus Paceibacterota bacterium]MCF7856921.1 type IV secretion system DNA-binding domain-containing protein [Candidatus Paceibacterota bacterium]
MSFDPNRINFFAQTDARGKNVQFGIKAKDRQRHVYVIGKTGMGKSTLLENMAVQDIQNGEGIAFIDPHGSAVENLLNYIPEHRVKDVLYFSPSDTECPVSFNIMEDVGPDKRHLVVSGLMSVFKKIFVDQWSARMEYILSNTLLALLEYPDSTLLGVNRMLSDKDYRKLVVDNVRDPGVKAFWVDEFAKYNERYMQEAGDAIKNKIGQFTANPIIRNIIGQPRSSFDLRMIMDEKKILIMNLSKGLIGETNATLLGSMLTTRIYLAAMSRADLPPEKMRDMPNFYFFVDEFQSFANASFANILSEARKYHLNLTIANQYIDQMEEEIRNAVFGNVGTTITFRVGPFDAEVLETVFTPQFLAPDIINLSFAQIYLTLMIDGIGSQPFSATTLPPIAPPQTSCKNMALASSRAQFTKPRAEVEELIHKFHEPIVKPKKVERVETIIPRAVYSSEKKKDVPREAVSIQKPIIQTTPAALTEQGARSVPEKAQGFRTEQRRTQTDSGAPARREMSARPRQQVQTSVPSRGPEKPKSPIKADVQSEDLRTVLKRLAATEKSNNPGDYNHEKGFGKEKRDQPEKPELKRALESLVKKEDGTVQNNSKSETGNETQTNQETEAFVNRNTNELAKSNSTPEEGVEKKHITPKELERMMRITTSDKPPI